MYILGNDWDREFIVEINLLLNEFKNSFMVRLFNALLPKTAMIPLGENKNTGKYVKTVKAEVKKIKSIFVL